MESHIGRRLAGHLLRINSHRSSLDIDLHDERSCDYVIRELLKTGCIIVRKPHTFALRVIMREIEA
jgi:hypothetical protein